MLAHELAHVARRDPQWLVVASGVERVLWFQPLNRVARRQIATTAEFLSDDWAVRRTGSGVALARCLAQVAEWIQTSPLGVPVAGMAEERSLLVTRVARLLETSMPSMTKKRVIALGAFAVLLATVILVPTVAGKPAPSAPAPTQASSDTTKDLTSDEVRQASMERAESLVRELSEHRVLTAKDSAVVLALIARLKDEDAEVRAAAAEALAKLEDARAVPGLVDAMRDSDKRVREAAIEALAKFKDKRALPGLQAALSDPSIEIQKQALEALSNFADAGGIQSAPIVALLNGSRDPEIVHASIHLLAELKDHSAVAGIRAQLNATNTDVRVAAIQALGELHDSESAPAILQRLTDANLEVRNAALNAMEELHARIPDATMATLFKDRDPDIRQRAASLAGERSMVGVVSGLATLVEDSNADVRMSAVQALANMADDSAREALRKALTSKDAKVRRSAVEALGERRP
jgi:HEAT repeat protein